MGFSNTFQMYFISVGRNNNGANERNGAASQNFMQFYFRSLDSNTADGCEAMVKVLFYYSLLLSTLPYV